MKSMVSDQTLRELINRIVQTANPRKIILFGSAGRKELKPNSDLDVLVVVPSGTHRRNTARSIYCNLVGVGFAGNFPGHLFEITGRGLLRIALGIGPIGL